MKKYFVNSEAMGRVPLEKIFKKVNAAVRERVEAVCELVMFLSAHLQQVVAVFKLEEVTPVFSILRLADKFTNLQILVNLVSPWQHRYSFVEELCKNTSDGPYVARFSVLATSKKDFRCTVPEGENLWSHVV